MKVLFKLGKLTGAPSFPSFGKGGIPLALLLGVLLFGTVAFAADAPSTRTVYDATLRNGFTIHHLRHETNGATTRLFTDDTSYIDVPTTDIADITESEEPLPVTAAPPEVKPKADLNEVISAASDKHQIDADLIHAVIRAESGFNPKARSSKGAQGLMQLMPSTAAQLGVTDAYDPAANVDAGTQFLRELLLKYNGDVIKALAAYNAGPQRVAQYHGVPPYRETRAYVARIVHDFNQKKLAQQKATAIAPIRAKKSATSSTKAGK